MLIAHPPVKTRTPPRTTDVADEGVANDSREPVLPPCGTPHDSDDSLADSNKHIRAQSQRIVKGDDVPAYGDVTLIGKDEGDRDVRVVIEITHPNDFLPFPGVADGDLRAATGGIQR
jgi:hypothetical protein